MFLFTFLLYHILSHLSRGFFNFFFGVEGRSRTDIHLLLSRCSTILNYHDIGWLLYPAYPQHFFSLRGLVHICIPHTGTPCGRGLCHQGLTRLSWVLPSASALFPSLCFYYSTLLAICQALFWKLSKFIFFRETLDLNLVKREWAGVTLSQLVWCYRPNLSDLFSFPSLLYPYCIIL